MSYLIHEDPDKSINAFNLNRAVQSAGRCMTLSTLACELHTSISSRFLDRRQKRQQQPILVFPPSAKLAPSGSSISRRITSGILANRPPRFATLCSDHVGDADNLPNSQTLLALRYMIIRLDSYLGWRVFIDGVRFTQAAPHIF